MRTAKRRTRCPSTDQLLAVLNGEQAVPESAPRLVAHLPQCPLCQVVAAAMQEFLQRDLAKEMAAAYRGVTALAGPSYSTKCPIS